MGLDKEYEPGGAFDRRCDGCHLESRPKTEQILGERCPVCGAAPMAWCDRSGDRGYLRTARGRRMVAEGTPASHQERKWAWQGHDPSEFPELRERERAGRLRQRAGNTDMDEKVMVIDAATGGVRCPVHDAARGVRCPGPHSACEARVRKWMQAQRQQAARQHRVAAARGRVPFPGQAAS